MNKILHFLLLSYIPFYLFGCNNTGLPADNSDTTEIIVGAERTDVYFPWIKDKNIAIIANQTSLINGVHLADSLINAGFYLMKIFSPEHGLRGEAEAGASLDSYTDEKTGVDVI